MAFSKQESCDFEAKIRGVNSVSGEIWMVLKRFAQLRLAGGWGVGGGCDHIPAPRLRTGLGLV